MRHLGTLAFTLAAITSLPASLSAQSTTLCSVDSAGVQGNQFSLQPAISADGRFVAFESVAGNLVPGDNNNTDDIFVRDTLTNTTTRASVATGGVEASGTSMAPRLSGDGRYVAFQSFAPDLVPGDTNALSDVFVHDRQTGITTRVSVVTGGTEANGASYAPSISDDGRFVAFHSAASNLVAGDTNNAWDVFVHDRQNGSTVRASVSSAGVQASAACSNAGLSGDGRYVAFHSNSSNLVAGDTNATWDVFVRDLVTGTTTRASLSSAGVQGNAGSVNGALSYDGRYVVFHSAAGNMVLNDGNGKDDVFRHDRQTGTTIRCSVNGNSEGDDYSRYALVSGDGRYVVFESAATNLVPFDYNGDKDIFVYDAVLGVTTRASVDSAGAEGNGVSSTAAISANGRYVSFDSYAVLAANDANNNGDVYLRDRGTTAPLVYCTAGTTSHGCVPSISYSGTPSASATSGFTVSIASVEGQSTGVIFYGISGSVAFPWSATSTSFYCVKTPTERTQVQSAGGTLFACDGALSLDFMAYFAARPFALGQPIYAGESFYTQGWFRDPPAPKTTNLSDALSFELQP